LETAEKKNGELQGQLSTTLLDTATNKALGGVKLIEGGGKLLAPHLKSQLKVITLDDGTQVTRVMEGENVRISMKQGSTDPMEPSELAELMREDKTYAPLYAGSGGSGTGAGGSDDGAGGGGTDLSKMSPTERLNYAHTHKS